MVRVLTLTDMLKYVFNNKLMGHIARETLHSLKLDNNAVIKMSADEPLHKAFRLMKDNNINGVAIVDSHEMLIGNISASDLKDMKFDQKIMQTLRSPIRDYIDKVTKPQNMTCDFTKITKKKK